ncbi:MAG TPA: serine hydrolase [Thermoanaerobaculia bacterium]|nr:serine hydrolase [Thermoanaerobaculia bacterium]
MALLLLAAQPSLGAQTPNPRLDRAVERLGAMEGVRTVDVWVGDERVASREFRGADHRAWDVKSASKSVLSALVGIALERGLLPGLDAPIAELLPEEAARLDDPAKRAITLRHLLTMTSGLGSTSGEHYGRWVGSADWVRAALARPLEHRPGEVFVYSTGSSHLVAAALERAVGRDLLAWGREALFDPLGLEVAGWAEDPQGRRFGGNSFRVTPEALGRLGRLYLAGGRWQGRQLVPAGWVAESTRAHAEGWPERYGAYGLLWWIPPFERERGFLASGYGGQFLLVLPERDAVVVVTATHRGKGAAWDRELFGRIERELVPALGAPSD